MNILFTCVGRRNYLVRYFREADPDGCIVGVDLEAEAPALQECDIRHTVPRVTDPDYVSIIAAVCERYRIDLVISLNDYELPVLAHGRAHIEATGARLLLSSKGVVDTCLDKLACSHWLRANGFDTPLTVSDVAVARAELARGAMRYPLFVKPRWGSGSAGVHRVECDEELEHAFCLLRSRLGRQGLAGRFAAVEGDGTTSVIVQQALRGHEFGVDVLNDFEARHRSVFVKRKLSMRSGETDRSCLRDLPALSAIGERLGRTLGHIGNLDCDLFFDGQRISVLELNPRFGGGYPFSHRAGARFPQAVLAWARGESYDTGTFERQHDRLFTKSDQVHDLDIDLTTPFDVTESRVLRNG